MSQQPSQKDEASHLEHDLRQLQKDRSRLQPHNNSYLWSVQCEQHRSQPRRHGIPALAGLAHGISSSEADFLFPTEHPPRRTVTVLQKPTLAPYRNPAFDPSALSDAQYRQLSSQSRAPWPIPQPQPAPALASPARLAVDYVGTERANRWMQGEIALSHWEIGARGEFAEQREREAHQRDAELAQVTLAELCKRQERRTRKKYLPKELVEGSLPRGLFEVRG